MASPAPVRVTAARLAFLLYYLISASALAATVYQQPADFIRQVFGNAQVNSDKLWLDKELRQQIHGILGHDLGVLRVRYWRLPPRTAWILEETGKEQPITAGIVVNDGKIELIKVLIFRETRGGEIRYPFFTDQFNGAHLGPDFTLSRRIDGISGATLSVNAIVKLARLALLFHQRCSQGQSE